MNDPAPKRFNWKLPSCGVLGAVLLSLPKIIFGNDLGTFLLSALIALAIGLVLLVVFLYKVRHQAVAAISMLVLFVAACGLSFKVSGNVRTTGRWLIQRGRYKADVLGLPNPPDGELKHIEWEGWGFAGSGDTVVYLVFDPADSLAAASHRHTPGKYNGIPCEVPDVHRLEKSWYTVLFYTDADWSHCA